MVLRGLPTGCRTCRAAAAWVRAMGSILQEHTAAAGVPHRWQLLPSCYQTLAMKDEYKGGQGVKVTSKTPPASPSLMGCRWRSCSKAGPMASPAPRLDPIALLFRPMTSSPFPVQKKSRGADSARPGKGRHRDKQAFPSAGGLGDTRQFQTGAGALFRAAANEAVPFQIRFLTQRQNRGRTSSARFSASFALFGWLFFVSLSWPACCAAPRGLVTQLSVSSGFSLEHQQVLSPAGWMGTFSPAARSATQGNF